MKTVINLIVSVILLFPFSGAIAAVVLTDEICCVRLHTDIMVFEDVEGTKSFEEARQLEFISPATVNGCIISKLSFD